METSLAKPQKCVVIRGGFELWVDNEKADLLQNMIEAAKQNYFIRWEENQFNTADVVGIFTPEVMEERTRRRNGQWQCHESAWHDRGEKCLCSSKDERERNARINAAIEACGKCANGFVQGESGMRRCECVAHFFTASAKV